jgi:hypothetical protein
LKLAELEVGRGVSARRARGGDSEANLKAGVARRRAPATADAVGVDSAR